METTQAVDRVDNGIQFRQFTPVRIPFFHWARDSIVANFAPLMTNAEVPWV